jgi:type I restriction enzyme, S subunit
MIDGLRAYPEMKHTGLPWLGHIPMHWEVRRNGRLFGARRETGFPDLPILEVSIRSGVRVRDFVNGARKQEMSDRSKYLRAVTGDIAYNMMRMWQGAVGVAPSDGLVSPAYVVARPFASIHAPYYAYLFRTTAYLREIDTFSRGIVPDRNRLYWESFKQMPSAYPPLEEQRLMAKFLDWHALQTTKLIRAKKKLIGLLNEQKQAIVHRAVTRGLDHDVKLEPGVPWLGEIPKDWTLRKLRHCGPIVGGMTPSMADRSLWDGDIPWVTPKDMKRFTISSASMQVAAKALAATSLRLIRSESVLLVVRGMILARRVPVARTDRPVTINQDMKAIVPVAGIDAGYLAYLIDDAQGAFVPLIDEAGHGTKRLPTERWKDLQFAFPDLAEQRLIVAFLDSQGGNARDSSRA